jgi:2-keto-3-deoxy-L-rhamnonate aldolase RhmA
VTDPRLSRCFDNGFKKRLVADDLQIGLWLNSTSALVAELVSYTGFSWVLIDAEHAPNDLAETVAQLHAFQGSPTSVIVRPPWNDMVMIKRLLDAGVQNFLVPFVQTVAEAQAAVAAVRYPPRGVRGVSVGSRSSAFGFVPDYWKQIDDHIGLTVQIEHMTGYGNLADICAVDGVDGVFVGPQDLAASTGHIVDVQHPEVQSLIAGVPPVARRFGKAAGILASNPEEGQRYVDMGYSFVGVGSDLGLLKGAALKAARAITGHSAED